MVSLSLPSFMFQLCHLQKAQFSSILNISITPPLHLKCILYNNKNNGLCKYEFIFLRGLHVSAIPRNRQVWCVLALSSQNISLWYQGTVSECAPVFWQAFLLHLRMRWSMFSDIYIYILWGVVDVDVWYIYMLCVCKTILWAMLVLSNEILRILSKRSNQNVLFSPKMLRNVLLNWRYEP
jgi:hypothetical protein